MTLSLTQFELNEIFKWFHWQRNYVEKAWLPFSLGDQVVVVTKLEYARSIDRFIIVMRIQVLDPNTCVGRWLYGSKKVLDNVLDNQNRIEFTPAKVPA